MDEGNEFESIEVDDFESAGIESMDSTPETAEELSLIMDEEVQGLPEEELVLPDDDFLEGDFAAEEPLPEEIPEENPEAVEVPEAEPMPEEISGEVPDMTSEEIPEEIPGDIPEEYPGEMPEEISQPMEESLEDISAMDAMTEYLSEHNYGKEDYETYSKDPEWQELNNKLLVEDGMEPIDYGEPSPEEAAETVEEGLPDEILPEEMPENLPEKSPETIESSPEELVPNEIPAEETVSTWMDDVTIESTEKTELMDDDVELTDDVTKEPIEEIAEAEDVVEETEMVPNLENVSGWLKEVNPNFDPFDLDSPYCNNCGSCAYAVYQRLEGISTDSCASAENIGYNSEMEALTGMEQVPMSPAEIEERLLEQGDGAHAIIGIDRAEGPGHWFNAACFDGKVVAIDGQSGEILDWPPDYGDVVNWEMSIKKGD